MKIPNFPSVKYVILIGLSCLAALVHAQTDLDMKGIRVHRQFEDDKLHQISHYDREGHLTFD